MPKLLSLLPSAIVTVNESAIEPYEEHVPPEQLLPHPDLPLTETRNWVMDNVDCDTLLMFNDDIDRVIRIGHRSKGFRDSRIIAGVIQQTQQCAEDLDVDVFGWSLTPNASMLHPYVRPFRAAAPISTHAWGVRGNARIHRRFDTTFRGCDDFDYTLETLKDDRLVLCDVRYHFDCGGMSRARGGESGLQKDEVLRQAQKDLRKKWGRHVGSSATQGVMKKNTWRTFSVNVKRTNPLGVS